MRIIDADALKDDINVYFADRYHLIDSIAERIDAAPTVESEIIRCGECKYAHLDRNGMCKHCDTWTDDNGYPLELYVDGNFYCGNAEKRTDEGELLLTTYCPRCGARLVQEGEDNGQNDK